MEFLPSAGLVSPAAQYNQNTSGNTSLKPEEANTLSFGAVLTPTFIPGLTLTLDYYNIKIEKYINGVNPNVTLSACYGAGATAASQALACPRIHRGSGGTGNLYAGGYVDATTINTGYLKTDGLDVEANYMTDLAAFGADGWGSLAINLLGTWTDTNVTSAYSNVSYNCAGLFGIVCGTPTPKWRSKMRVTWDTPWDNLQLSLQWRHITGAKLDVNTANPVLNALCGSTSSQPCPDPADARIPDYDYFDLSAAWEATKGIEIRAGVNNILDKDPPVYDSTFYGVSSPPFGNGNTYPGVYDSLGRVMFVSVTAKL